MSTVWIQQGTVFNPNIELKRRFRFLRKAAMQVGISIYVSSGNDSDHRMDSCHFSDDAIDIKDVTGEFLKYFSKSLLQQIFGDDFDICIYSWGVHIEYDPK